MKNSNYRRYQRRRNIKRKIYIIENIYKDDIKYFCANQPGRLDGNKIHCSCPVCSIKTRNKGKRKKGNYHRSINYKLSDLKRQMSMDDQELEYTGSTGTSAKRRRHG